nr:hypothetical protein [uncultured Moraxella sp.]
MSNFAPFQNDSQSVSISTDVGEITFENQGDQVNMYGNASFTIDKQSLELAKQLQQQFAEMVDFLQKNGASQIDHAQIAQEQQANVTEVTNPFL